MSPILVADVVVAIVVGIVTSTVVMGIATTVAASSTVITSNSARVTASSTVNAAATASVAVETAVSTPIVVSVVVIGVIIIVIVIIFIIPIVIVVCLIIVILVPAASTMTVSAVRVCVMRRVLGCELRAHALHCLHHRRRQGSHILCHICLRYMFLGWNHFGFIWRYWLVVVFCLAELINDLG